MTVSGQGRGFDVDQANLNLDLSRASVTTPWNYWTKPAGQSATARLTVARQTDGTLAFNNMSGLGRPGSGTLKVDGKAVQTIEMPHTLPMILQWDESFDIGSDTLTGVNDEDYKPPFTFTGKLNKLTIKVDRPKLSPEDITKLETAMRNNRSSE